MTGCLEELEKFINVESIESALVRIALAHVQFETIHPFLDGNGRLGRLLIALLLEAWGLLDARLLYLSLHFKRNQMEYYAHLVGVRTRGDWESWIHFFLEGVCITAQEAVESSQKLFQLIDRDRKRLLNSSSAVVPAIRLFELLPNHPAITISQVVKLLETTKPTAGKAIDVLVDLGILEVKPGTKRNRVFRYRKYMNILIQS
jgi:Fic family protein